MLGLVLRRLSPDWAARWGHPILAVESFVDETYAPGTCSRACGFEAVGATVGFARASRDFYRQHDQPKQLRAEVTPEEMGLCGCWQVIGVERLRYDLSKPKAEPSLELGYYASSVAFDQYTRDEVLDLIRGHWAAIENGTHCRRDVTLGEDACRVTEPRGAEALVCRRNLTNGSFALEKAKKTDARRYPQVLVPTANLLERLENPQPLGGPGVATAARTLTQSPMKPRPPFAVATHSTRARETTSGTAGTSRPSPAYPFPDELAVFK